MYAASVIRCSARQQILRGMRIFIQAENLSYAIIVTGDSVIPQPYAGTKEFTQEKNHTVVMSVGGDLIRNTLWDCISVFTVRRCEQILYLGVHSKKMWTDTLRRSEPKAESLLEHSSLGKNFNRQYFEIFFIFFLPENRLCHFIQIVSFHKNTPQPLYNMVHYNTVLDITRFKDGSQKCIDYIKKWP